MKMQEVEEAAEEVLEEEEVAEEAKELKEVEVEPEVAPKVATDKESNFTSLRKHSQPYEQLKFKST
jgi:hypothetical protein